MRTGATAPAKRVPRRDVRRSVAAIGAVAVALTLTVGPVLAALTDQATSSASVATDTLDPPTGLECNGGLLSCTITLLTDPVLTWVETPDLYATGYTIWRSTTSGSGYVLQGSVSGRTITTWTDTGALSLLTTYHYVVVATSPSWTSTNSNEVAVFVAL